MVKGKIDGGWTDPNETACESVEREVFVESGFIVKSKKILAVYDKAKQGYQPPFPFHVYKLIFLCDLHGGKKTISFETDDVDLFKENKIPELSISRVSRSQIIKFFEFYKNPGLPTDFDWTSKNNFK